MERKLVTILFADAIGSTSLGDRLDPERLRAVLDAYFEAMAAAVEAWGGTVEKFIGDAVMAVFGVPAVREDDAERALNAAMEMMQRLADLNRELDSRHGVTLRMRIGVNSGEVVTGGLGEGNQRLVSGDPVNVAARLQVEAEPDSVLAGERTYLAARHTFDFDEPVEYELKGKPGQVTARRVLGRKAEPTRGVPDHATPLVGRGTELQALTGLLDEVLDARKPRFVTVLGPAGVGKSRLVQEFVSAVKNQHPQARVLKGRCLAAGRGITYWALGEILQAACDIRLDDSAATAVEKLRAVVADPSTAEALAATAGIAVAGGRLSQMTPEAVADELGRAWPRFASAQTGDLAVWVIEDLHWAGDALLEMLERVTARTTGPLLVIGTARPDLVETHPGFGGGSENFSTLSLRPLSEKHSEELFQALLAVADLPANLAAEILRKAQGNPFFLEEIVRRLIEVGALVQEDGRWRSTTSSAATPLPDSLLALLSARIDSIPERDKHVLQQAAVVGKVFWAEPLERSLGVNVSPALLSLERRGLIRARSTSSLANHDEYDFKHVLVRDVAYASLPKAQRARAHAEVGAWIGEIAGDRTDEFEELLAYHYRSAVAGDDADLAWTADELEPIRRKAFAHLVAAGVQARRRFAIAKAVELHEQAIDLATGDDERLRSLEELGDDHESAYHGDDAQHAYVTALEIARRADRPSERARLCSKLAEMMTNSPGAFKRSPDPDVVEAFIAEGLANTVDEELTARLHVAYGHAARLYRGSEPFGQGHKPDPVPVQKRIEAIEQARDVGERIQSFQVIWYANLALGLLYSMAGRYDAQLELALEDLALVDRLASRIQQGDVVRRAAIAVMTIGGNYREGLALAMRSLELSRDTNPHQIMHGTNPVMAALYELGRSDEIPPFLEEHLRAFQLDPAVECDFVRDGPLIGAVVSARSGDFERARELGDLIGDPMVELARATAWHARLEIAFGHPENARQISSGKALEDRSYGPPHARSMLEALIALEGWDELERFVPLARRQVAGLAILEPCCDRAEAMVAFARGDRIAARDGFARALAGFDALNAGAEAAATRKLMTLDAPARARPKET